MFETREMALDVRERKLGPAQHRYMNEVHAPSKPRDEASVSVLRLFVRPGIVRLVVGCLQRDLRCE